MFTVVVYVAGFELPPVMLNCPISALLGSKTVQVTLFIEEPSFVFTDNETLKLITGLAEVVNTESDDIKGSEITGAEIEGSMIASLFSSQE